MNESTCRQMNTLRSSEQLAMMLTGDDAFGAHATSLTQSYTEQYKHIHTYNHPA